MAELVCYRAASYTGALWQTPNPGVARFNRAAEAATQYLSLHPLGPWAELARQLRNTRADIERMVEEHGFRYRTWALRINDGGLLEVGFDNAATNGITPHELVADDYDACQTWASGLRAAAVRGIRVPSAALPGTDCVVLFGPFVESGYLDDPIDPTDIPSSVTAEDATALRSLLSLVCLFGETHAGLDAYLGGEDFEFLEPTYALS